MNKPVYLELQYYNFWYDFWYNCLKPKYGEKAKPCHMDEDSSIVHIKTAGIYKNIAEYVETTIDTSKWKGHCQK